jgi:hypothetical protein
MTIDSIITEWTYRLPKGYPTTDSDYTILYDVLSEMTAFSREERDRIVNQAKGLAPIVTESVDNIQTSLLTETINSNGELLLEGYTKEDLIAVIKSTVLPDNLIQYISRLIDSATSESSIIKILQNEKGFDSLTAKRIFDKAVELNSYNQLQTLLMNSSNQIDFDELGQSGNLNYIINKVNLSNEFSEWLYTYKPTVGGVTVGNGENYLRITVQGGHVPTVGDVGIYDKNLEMKVTMVGGFRLRGQSGYGNGNDVSKYIVAKLSDIYKQRSGQDLDWGQYNEQLYYKQSISPINQKVKEFISQKYITRNDFVDVYTIALQNLYKGYSGDIKNEVVEPSIDNDGVFKMNELLNRLATIEFLYYANSSEWDYLMAVGKSKNYIILDKSSNFETLLNIFSSKFLISSPVTSPGATSQDSLTKLEYKG